MRRRERGFLLIAAVVLIVIAAALVTAMTFMFVTGSESGTDHLQSGQGLFLAESGLEYGQRSLAQNLNNWYRSTVDPITAPTQNLGQGTFTVATNLAATMLRTRIPTTGANTINAYTTDRFPTPTSSPILCNPCYLQINDDMPTVGAAEFVRYTGISGNTFTGVTRGQSIGPVGSLVTSTALVSERSTIVYPVTTLKTALLATCADPPGGTIDIVAHPKFLATGTINVVTNTGAGGIQNEEMFYSGSILSADSTTITLTGVQRCKDFSTPGTNIGHNVGDPVTPVTAAGDSASFQAELVSTGTVSNTNRIMRRTIER